MQLNSLIRHIIIFAALAMLACKGYAPELSYTVAFVSNNGSEIAPQTVTHGGKAVPPDSPVKDGHVFGGWHYDEECLIPWDFENHIVHTDMTLHAKWLAQYAVAFETGGGSAIDPQIVTEGGAITRPDNPNKAGYSFAGWFGDAGLHTLYDFNTPVAASITLYAKWAANTYTVTFDKNGGTTDASPATKAVTVPDTTIDALPIAPTRAGYTFAGWTMAASGGTAFTATTTVTANITVYAQWIANTYTVIFDKNGGTADASPATKTVTVPATTIDTLPIAPTRAGYTFAGWTTQAAGGTAFTSTTAVTANITVYAQWSVTVTFNRNGGTTDANPAAKTVTTPATTVGTLPTAPAKTGYTFTGWTTAASGGTAFTADTAVTASITVYAQWKVKAYDVYYFYADPDCNEVIQQDYGTKIAEPNPALPVGLYTGSPSSSHGWYNGDTKWDFAVDTMPAYGITLIYKYGTRISSVADNNLAAAVAYINANPGTYTLVLGANISAGTQVLTAANANLTIVGAWATRTITYTGGGNGTLFSLRGANQSVTIGDRIALSGVALPVQMWMQQVWINPGTFLMGSPATEPNRGSNETQHSVTLTKGFYMGKYQVTQELYQMVMGSNPSRFTSNPAAGEVQAKRPVEQVSWYAALVFCNKLSMMEGLTPVYSISGSTNPANWGAVPTNGNATWNAVTMNNSANGYRLPTEAEWEYACRAGTTTAYNTGASISDNTGWYTSNSGNMTHEVGKKPANAWGLYDMHGNVWEWCWDWYGSNYYTDAGAGTNPAGPTSGSNRVERGSSWNHPDAQGLRSSYRDYYGPEFRYDSFGFRVVRLAP
jgi:uncharacterized repeat protein (TIGR02543 family)